MSDFEDIVIGKLTFRFNQPEQEVAVDIPLKDGVATLISKPSSEKMYNVRLEFNGVEMFHFVIDKIITDIGSSAKSNYYKILSGNMEKNGLEPDYEGEDFKEKFNNFIFDLQTANGHVIEVTNNLKWQNLTKKEPVSWAKVSGSFEKFPDEDRAAAEEIIRKGNLIEEILDLAELKAVGQRESTALVTLIALSSFLEDSIHHISTGPPGTSKSTITDTIFEIFPEQRKEGIGKGSTPASLANMTVYKEGSSVLKSKFIRLGDLGNEEEIKAALPLLSIFKELMSDKKYNKTISIPQGDEHAAKRLKIDGVGSVHLSTIESNVESQYDSRAIISSPDDTVKTAEEIKKHQLDEVDRLFKNKEFRKRRPVIACSIEMIYREKEKYERRGVMDFLNPYGPHMNEIFKIDASKNANRNRNHIRDLPKSVTLAHLLQREIWMHPQDQDMKVIVTPEDYIYALKIIGKPVLQMLSEISPQQKSYIRLILERYVLKENGEPKHLETYKELLIADSKPITDWENKTTKAVCFTKKDISTALGVSDTTVTRILDEMVGLEIIYKRQIGKKNYYFPTEKFISYSESFTPELYSEEELEVGGEVHMMAEKQYEETIQRLKKAGYILRKRPT